MNPKVVRVIRLVTERDLLLKRLQAIEDELEHGVKMPMPRRGPKLKHDSVTVARVTALSRSGLSWRKIEAQTGIPHNTVGAILNRKGK